MHALGQPNPEYFRLAAPLLPARRQFRRHLQRADGDHGLGEMRRRPGPTLQQLHGPLRVRTERGHGLCEKSAQIPVERSPGKRRSKVQERGGVLTWVRLKSALTRPLHKTVGAQRAVPVGTIGGHGAPCTLTDMFTGVRRGKNLSPVFRMPPFHTFRLRAGARRFTPTVQDGWPSLPASD